MQLQAVIASAAAELTLIAIVLFMLGSADDAPCAARAAIA